MSMLGYKIVCQELEEAPDKLVFGSDIENGYVIIRSSQNEQLLYLDGAAEGPDPIYLGFTKSRGTQQQKEPVLAGDFVGGIQSYPRKNSGSRIGYCHTESPLAAALHFKVEDTYTGKSTAVPTEMIIGLSDEHEMTVKLTLNSSGSLAVSGTVSAGSLTITDKPVNKISDKPVQYVEAIYNNTRYAIPLYNIL